MREECTEQAKARHKQMPRGIQKPFRIHRHNRWMRHHEIFDKSHCIIRRKSTFRRYPLSSIFVIIVTSILRRLSIANFEVKIDYKQ